MSEKKQTHNQPINHKSTVSLDGYEHFGNTCSATDCTGLIPALPTTEEELDAYEEMYQFCAKRPDEP